MPRPRAPWWMYVVAASFLGAVALFFYQLLWGPSLLPGFQGDITGAGMHVAAVQPDSPEERAGLKPGDWLLAVDGKAIRNVRDWEAIRANTEVGRPERWEISRGGKRLDLTVTVPPRAWKQPVRRFPDVLPGYLLFIVISLALGLIIAFRRPNEPTARIGAWTLATAAITFGFPDGWAATWRHLPGVLGLFLWIPEVSRFAPDAILLTFFLTFPKKLFRARWPWFALWAPALAFVPWRVMGMYQVVYQPGNASEVPAWVFPAIALRSALYLACGLAALLVSYVRLEDVNQRRRVRVLLAGLVVSTLGVVAWVATGAGRALSFRLVALQAVLYLLWLAFPLSFAYAILRHRLFDIRVIVRQGLQYALARGVLVSVVPALAVLLLLDLLWHGDQPAIAILRARGWVYAGLGAFAFLAQARQKQWLAALDRRFFREHYDAQHLLREVVEEVRAAGTFERVAPQVVARIEMALHPEFVALLVREPREANYRSLATAPAGQVPPPLPRDSKLLAVIRLLGKPLEVSLTETGWLKQQLPHEETDFLRQARIDLLVPVATSPERTEVLLVLGSKRSEEPYSGEDQDLLVAVAASLGLLLEKPVMAAPPVGGVFEECPQCGSCYDPGAERCTREGKVLQVVRLPRLLAERYRIERRLGRGGMGTVYEASDTALERRVAVKVIREDLVGSTEAADRFRREAKVAAAFAHPNVVTVYDFGIAADNQAFLVMELLQGATLREELQKSRRLPAPRVREILRGVCAAMEAAHHRQLIHRDLKPENIFLARGETEETAKVLDFGIAKFLPTCTQATVDTGGTALLGTLNYMAPEQLHGQVAAPAWDLWALAVVAYEMLTGVHPFGGATAAECYAAVLAGHFAPVTAHLPDAPARWQEFLASALALDPARRPQSARTFLTELEKALA